MLKFNTKGFIYLNINILTQITLHTFFIFKNLGALHRIGFYINPRFTIFLLDLTVGWDDYDFLFISIFKKFPLLRFSEISFFSALLNDFIYLQY